MTTATEPVYAILLEAGCKLDHHESDLYVEDTPTARTIIKAAGLQIKPFRSQRPEDNGATWLELPFMFQPFWDSKPGSDGYVRDTLGTMEATDIENNLRSIGFQARVTGEADKLTRPHPDPNNDARLIRTLMRMQCQHVERILRDLGFQARVTGTAH